jgi:uncharacterized protein (TIGR01777 family)
MMKIVITGGTGFIGSHLTQYLLDQGDHPIVISRRPKANTASIDYVTWDQLEQDPGLLQGVEAIVNLAGESINQRWTSSAKDRIIKSRVDAAEAVRRLIQGMEVKPKVVINGSGISIYGSSLTKSFDETSPATITDFLASVVQAWEQEADTIHGVRLVKLRVGIVLGTDGGALPKMMLPYKLGAGGPIGSGQQWLSWIHIEDMVRAIRFAIVTETLEGPMNGTAPHPVTNDEFGRSIGRVLHRPHWFPVPALLFNLIFGEMSMLLLEGQQVVPKKLLEYGFTFKYPYLETALNQLVPKN